MKTIYIISIEDDDVGEVEGAFDAKGNFIDLWSLNDASFRSEYFSDLMKYLGVEVGDAPRKLKLKEKLKEEAKKIWDM